MIYALLDIYRREFKKNKAKIWSYFKRILIANMT